MILTRYLYPKHNVEYSLKLSLFQENLKESLFWAYEIYFSGFKQQVLQLLLDIFEKYFENSFRKNKINTYLQKKLAEWQKNNVDSMVAIFVENIIRCQMNECNIYQDYDKNIVKTRICDVSHTQILYIVYKDVDIQQYKNRPLIVNKSWKIPARVCLFHCLREPGSPELNLKVYENWLFYASGSSLWKSRIQKYHGMVDLEENVVKFSDEDSEESFYNLYDLEPDEQSLSIQNKWFGK